MNRDNSDQLAVDSRQKDPDLEYWPELNYQQYKQGLEKVNPKSKTFSRKRLRYMHRDYLKRMRKHNFEVEQRLVAGHPPAPPSKGDESQTETETED